MKRISINLNKPSYVTRLVDSKKSCNSDRYQTSITQRAPVGYTSIIDQQKNPWWRTYDFDQVQGVPFEAGGSIVRYIRLLTNSAPVVTNERDRQSDEVCAVPSEAMLQPPKLFMSISQWLAMNSTRGLRYSVLVLHPHYKDKCFVWINT